MESLLALDTRVSLWFQAAAPTLPELWKLLAIFGVYAVPAALLWSWFRGDKLTAFRAGLTGIAAWFLLNGLISRLLPRDRPPQLPFLNFPAHEFLFDRPGPSFPSDHAAFMTTVTLVFALAGQHRIATFLAWVTAATLLARVVTAQHWAGDIAAGVAVGAVAAWLSNLARPAVDRYVGQPLVAVWRRLTGSDVRPDA